MPDDFGLLATPNGIMFCDMDEVIYKLADSRAQSVRDKFKLSEQQGRASGRNQIVVHCDEDTQLYELFMYCAGAADCPNDTGWLYWRFPNLALMESEYRSLFSARDSMPTWKEVVGTFKQQKE